jgi:hypothetical protein
MPKLVIEMPDHLYRGTANLATARDQKVAQFVRDVLANSHERMRAILATDPDPTILLAFDEGKLTRAGYGEFCVRDQTRKAAAKEATAA